MSVVLSFSLLTSRTAEQKAELRPARPDEFRCIPLIAAMAILIAMFHFGPSERTSTADMSPSHPRERARVVDESSNFGVTNDTRAGDQVATGDVWPSIDTSRSVASVPSSTSPCQSRQVMRLLPSLAAL